MISATRLNREMKGVKLSKHSHGKAGNQLVVSIIPEPGLIAGAGL